MTEIIDLSQDIFAGMPVYKSLPPVDMKVYATHEQWGGLDHLDSITPSVHELQMSEHTGTHVDALNHMHMDNKGQSIDTMSLHTFYTRGICLDFTYKNYRELIYLDELKEAIKKDGLTIQKGDTVLLCTDHYRKAFGTTNWDQGPGIDTQVAQWLGEQQIAAFGVETMSPGIPGITNKGVHEICGKLGFTHYENMVNLYQLIGRGPFKFIGLPLKIRGGTGSPVRAVAIFE